MIGRAGVACLTVLALGACAGGDGGGPSGDVASDTSSATVATSVAASVGEIVSSPTTTVAAAPVTTELVTTTVPPSIPLVEGIEGTIELLTATSAVGVRPLLEWSPVDGATWYMVTVFAPDGTAYWSWTGESTSVHVGGEPRLDDDVPGPSIVDGMAWAVTALDGDLVPIAVSDRRPIAP